MFFKVDSNSDKSGDFSVGLISDVDKALNISVLLIVFCKDLSEMDTARQPIVTVQAKLQKTAYPALLHRRKRIIGLALLFFVFIRVICIEDAKVSKIGF